MGIHNITGPPVEGDNFFGREKDLEFAWEHIEKGNSLILAAPRRVGKSSFAKKIIAKAKSENWNTLEINLEEVKSEEGFLKVLIKGLEGQDWWNNTKRKYSEIITSILSGIKLTGEFEGIRGSFEYQKQKEDLYEDLKKLLDHNEKTLIMVDELTVLLNSFLEADPINGKKSVEFFLNWLRSFRQVSGTKIRWVFCSSIGIDNFTSQHNLSYTFNDVQPYEIGAFSIEKAKELLKALSTSNNITIPNEIESYMLAKIGWFLPYFIQIFYCKIHILIQVEEKAINNETIDEAYLSLIEEKHLNTWEERLKDYNHYKSSANFILTKLSNSPVGLTRANIFSLLYTRINDHEKTEIEVSKILQLLKNDGYLIVQDSKYFFRSPLLRDFWYNRFVK